MSKVKEALEQMIKDLLPVPAALQAQVISVDKAKAVCKVKLINSELELDGVRLRAVNDGSNKGLTAYPENQSKVIVGFVNNNLEEAYIESYSTLSEIRLMSGEFGGLIKINDLVSRLNAIEKDINNLKSIFLSWTPSPQDGGLALKTKLVLEPSIPESYASVLLSETQKSDLENTKVNHG